MKKICFLLLFLVSLLFAEGNENSGKQLQTLSNAETIMEEIQTSEDIEESEKSFYSIQSSGIASGYEDKWFFEELNDEGKPIISVFYEKDKLIEKKTYIYKDGYKDTCEITLPDKLIKIKYNKKRLEVEKIIYDAEGKKELEKYIYTYNEKDLLTKTFFKKNGIEYVSKFEYGVENKKQAQTDFVNGNKVSRVEYKIGKKIIYLFESGKEIGVVEEEI